MPLFIYRCEKCEYVKKRITDKTTKETCPTCTLNLVRASAPPSTKKMEVIDNGFMPRRVERMVDIKEVMKDRSDKHDRETKDGKTQEN